MIYLLIGYMWLFVHRPFEIWTWMAPYHVERVYMLITLAYWATQPKTWISCRSHAPVFLLAGTYLFASQTSPYATFETVEDWFKIFVFYVLIVTSIRSERELTALVLGCVGVVAVYELHSLREYFNGRGVYRMGTWRMVGVDATKSDPNSFGASVVYSLPFLYPVWTLAQTRRQELAVVGIAVLGIACILLTGSRSAFVGLLVLAVIASLASKYRWRIVGTATVLLPLVWVSLRPDLRERYLTLVDPTSGPESAELSAEGRSKSFWEGVDSFIANPLFGAGLESHRARTGVATHNLYNQAFGEMGVFGLAVLIGFAWSFPSDFREARQRLPHSADLEELFLYRICLAGAISCLLLFVLGWSSHNLQRYNWLWFGGFSGIALYFLRERAATADAAESEPIGPPRTLHNAVQDIASRRPLSSSRS